MRVSQHDRQGRRLRGFTLLELLVSIAVFSLMALTLYAGMELGGRAWDAGTRHSDDSARMRLVDGFLRRYVSAARPLAIREGRGWRVAFAGTPTELRFITEMPPQLGRSGLYWLDLQTEGLKGDRRLVVRRQPYRETVPQEAAEPADQSVLIDGLRSVRFEYFGQGTGDAHPRWRAVWDDRGQLPTLFRLRASSHAAGAWPSMVVSLRADALQYDTNSGSTSPESLSDALPPPGGGTPDRSLEGVASE